MNTKSEALLRDALTTRAESLKTAEDAAVAFQEDILETSPRFDKNGAFENADLYLTIGGPTIWIDAKRGVLCGTWGHGTREEIALKIDFAAAFLSLCEEAITE